MADWVLAVERAYVAAATGGSAPGDVVSDGDPDLRARARAAAGAVASHYLAVGTPRSFGLVVDGDASAPAAARSLEAHRTWFKPTDIRCAGQGSEELAAGLGARATSLPEALACDIVCVHAPIAIGPDLLRRGTHVNVLAAATLADDLPRLATIFHEQPDLGALAAGLIDGRQLDELTVFVLGDAAIARAALDARITT